MVLVRVITEMREHQIRRANLLQTFEGVLYFRPDERQKTIREALDQRSLHQTVTAK